MWANVNIDVLRRGDEEEAERLDPKAGIRSAIGDAHLRLDLLLNAAGHDGEGGGIGLLSKRRATTPQPAR